MELNPNHPVTKTMHDHWHKVAAILMSKFDRDHVVITPDDIREMEQRGIAGITVEEKPDGIHLKTVDMETAERLARQEGGLPH